MINFNSVHFIGIGGSGASGVAELLLREGKKVSGSDVRISSRTKRLEDLGAVVYEGQRRENVSGADLVLYSPAIPARDPNNPELLAAKEENIPAQSWQEFIGKYFKQTGRKGLLVAGAHGKGSTCAVLAQILITAGLDPFVLLGAEMVSWDSNLRVGEGDYYILEADEFDRNFFNYYPYAAVLSSLEYEHPETYPDFSSYKQAFVQFLGRIPSGGYLAAYNSENTKRFFQEELVSVDFSVETFGVAADWSIGSSTYQRLKQDFSVEYAGDRFGEFTLGVPAKFNLENALSAIALAHFLGISKQDIRQALEDYQGLHRRFEVLEADEWTYVYDYGHSPEAIETVISEAREIWPQRRIVLVFQPHMYSRTKTFFENFVTQFKKADQLYLLDIYGARETGTTKETLVSSQELAKAAEEQGVKIKYVPNPLETVAGRIEPEFAKDDVVIVMGAGSISEVFRALKDKRGSWEDSRG
ncbi:MAG: UDP-N-acetylmuramate--L-alanine ligase [Patescibacteria group bacterium]